MPKISFGNFCTAGLSVNDNAIYKHFQQQKLPTFPSTRSLSHPVNTSSSSPVGSKRRKKKDDPPTSFIRIFAAIIVVISLIGYIYTRDTNILGIATSTLTFLLGYGIPKE